MIPYMVGKLAPISSHLTRVFVKYVSGRVYFRAVPSRNRDKYITSPPPPQSSNLSSDANSAAVTENMSARRLKRSVKRRM